MTGNKGKTKIDKVVGMPAKGKAEAWKDGDIPRRTGNCNVLIVAPHGFPGDDDNTYEISRELADKLDCYAIVNKTYRKPPKVKKGSRKRKQPDKNKKWIDLNRVNQATQYLKDEYIRPLTDIAGKCIKKHGSMLVVWVHGIKDKNLAPAVTLKNPVDMVIGVGQAGSKKDDCPTAKKETVDRLVEIFKKNPDRPINATRAKRGSRYCGLAKNNMNQFFREKYNLDKVQSIQLEIRKNGFRNTKKQIEATASVLDNAIRSLGAFQKDRIGEVIKLPQGARKSKPEFHRESVPSQKDKKLVEDAINRLRKIYSGDYHKVMLYVGNYLIEKFYAGNFAYPRQNEKVRGAAWNLFIDQLKDENRTGHLPSKSWVYNAIRLAVDEHHFRSVHTYALMGHSQKVMLTHIKDADKKRDFLQEPEIHQLTVKEFKARINEFLGKRAEISIDEILYKQDLADLKIDELVELKKKADQELETYQAKLEHRGKVLGLIAEAMKTQGIGIEMKEMKNITISYHEFSVDVPEAGYEAGEL